MPGSNKGLEGFHQSRKWVAAGIGSIAICLIVMMLIGNFKAITSRPSYQVWNFSLLTLSLAQWRLAHPSPRARPVQPKKITSSPSIRREGSCCLLRIYGFQTHILVSATRKDLPALP